MAFQHQVGPYVLDRVIGQGGTASVWLARHRDFDRDLVLKVLTAKFTKRARFREYFANEIRAVARLNHPNIARVLDAGVEQGGTSPLPAGSPYVVMEYIPDGCLHDITHNMTWTSVRDVLLVLLDALAHAHAHDVVHLDLKPGNVLLRREANLIIPVLTDFGISRTEDAMAPTERSGVVGTPKYMAPEQIRGQWRRTGAATDLYALGCMAFQLVTGRVPFDAGDSYAILRAHLKDPLPEFKPRMRVPSGLRSWIDRLLQKEPGDRYETAADAAFALVKLDAEPAADWLTPSDEDEPKTAPIDLTILDETLNIQAIRDSVDTRETRLRSLEVPPMPISWQRRADFRRDTRSLGLALLRDRVPPVVGRFAERDLLWEALARVNDGEPRAVLIRGETGLGASRLAEWLARLAEEVGAAQALVIRSAPTALEGLALAIGRKLKVAGGKAMEAIPIIRDLLIAGRRANEDDLVDSIILADLLTGTPIDATQSEKRNALVRLMTAMSRRRALVVVCDNVELFHDVWNLGRMVFDENVGALLLATTCAETFASQDEILQHPGVTELRLGPLADPEIAEIADQLVWLTPHTAHQLVTLSEGLPGRVVRWLTSWVERDLLVPTPQGFGIRRRLADETLSDAAKQAAQAVLSQFEDTERMALGVAATFGTRFNTEIWFDTLGRLKISPRKDLLERAVRLGVLDRDPSGREYEFADLLLHEEFSEYLAAQGSIANVLSVCADALQTAAGPTRDLTRLESIARMRAAAGELEKALPILGWLALRNFHEDNIDDARRLLARHETLLSRTDGTVRKREGWMGDVIRLWLREGDGEPVAPETVAHAYEGALQAGQLVAAAEAARLRAKILRGISLESANEALEEAANAITRAGGGSLPEIGTFWISLGWNRGMQGQFDIAFEYFLRAEPIFVRTNDTLWQTNLLRARAYLNLQRANYSAARTDITRAVEFARSSGHRNGLAGAYMYLGELDRHLEDFESARSQYRAAYDLYRQNPANRWIAECNLALCEIGAGNYPEARRILERLIESAQFQRKLFAPFYLALAVVAGTRDDWTDFDQRFAEVMAEIHRLKHVEYDIAWLLEKAGDVAERAGHIQRAHTAYDAAATMWRAMGRTSEFERARNAAQRCGS